MNDQTDSELLRDYAENGSEPAFAELVRRYIDFVHSAARRMVRDSHIAEDVTQGVFVALAKDAARLQSHPVLAGWLHCTVQNIAAQAVRTGVRRQAREKKAAAMNALLSAETDAQWDDIAPVLDAALGELGESDRDALLLRYFRRMTADEMAKTLGISSDAAQKRVSRALDRLREFLVKRGITVGAGGLAVAISANAVQAAPMGLAFTVSTAVTMAGTAIAATTTTATKAIAMTTMQKMLITATIVCSVTTGIYEMRQSSQLRNEVQKFQKQQASLAAQVNELSRERDEVAGRLAVLRGENERLNRNSAELLKLRSEIVGLRNDSRELARLNMVTSGSSKSGLEDTMSMVKPWGLREPHKVTELQNVGGGTATSAMESLLWAAHYNPSALEDMILMPPNLSTTMKPFSAVVWPDKSNARSLEDFLLGSLNLSQTVKPSGTFGEQMAKEIVRRTARKLGSSQQIWLDGAYKPTFRLDGRSSCQYASGYDLRMVYLVGEPDSNKPNVYQFDNLAFANVDGLWKLVIDGSFLQ